MKKFTLFVTLLTFTALNVFAQQEIPMFFDSELGLATSNIVRKIAYSPDGSKIAIASMNRITIWDAATGKEITRMSGVSNNNVSSIVFSPNGRQMASCASRDSTIKIWDISSGTLIRSITQSGVYAIAFSPDGGRIAGALGSSGSYSIKIWNATNGSGVRTLTGHTDDIVSLTYSPDGRQILSASFGETIQWNTENGQIIRTIGGSFVAVYSPNGRNIAAANFDGDYDMVIQIFNTETGQKLRTILNTNELVLNLAYSLDGKQLLCITDNSDNTIIKVFDPETSRELRSFNNSYQVIAFSSDGRRILADPVSFRINIAGTYYAASYATLLDATTGRTVGTIGYGPLNVGAKAYADMQIARFLNDTAAVTRNEAILQYITSNGYATRQEVEAFYRGNVGRLIGELVDKQVNRIISDPSFNEFRNNPQRNDTVVAINLIVKKSITDFYLSPNRTILNALRKICEERLILVRGKNAEASAAAMEEAGYTDSARDLRNQARQYRDSVPGYLTPLNIRQSDISVNTIDWQVIGYAIKWTFDEVDRNLARDWRW